MAERSTAQGDGHLLDLAHPQGGSKAKFFLARGFDRRDPDMLADALASQATAGWPGEVLSVPGAVKHRIVGPITCSDGSAPEVLTVWQVSAGSVSADFITARPDRPKGR